MIDPEVYYRDAERFDRLFADADAIIEIDGVEVIDPSKVPADLLRAYQSFISVGYANGLINA